MDLAQPNLPFSLRETSTTSYGLEDRVSLPSDAPRGVVESSITRSVDAGEDREEAPPSPICPDPPPPQHITLRSPVESLE